MEHEGEIWQEYDKRGSRKMNGGVLPDEKMEEYYSGVAIMLYRYNDGRVEYLFQHRAKGLRGNPDKWDVSAGGHINYNEPKLETVVREAGEEIGVEIDKNRLEFAASYVLNNNKGIVFAYFYDWTGCEDEFHFHDGEVEEVKWVSVEDLADFWENLKPQLRGDDIFELLLKREERKIKEKYSNGDSAQ